MEDRMKEMTIDRDTERKFYKKTFEKISEDRRRKIFDVAIKEFAANGYNATNINVIAKKAEISIGSMYSYFASKEDLFLTIIDSESRILENALREVNIDDGNIFSIFERMLRVARDYAMSYPEMNQIYLDITTQGLSSLANRLSHKLEEITVELYRDVIIRARQRGIISTDIDVNILSFCLDNLTIMYQFSFTSDYHKERMKIFLGNDISGNDDIVIENIMKFVKRAMIIK